MFPFTAYMETCLEELETSPVAAITDAALAAWFKFQRVIDVSAGALGLRHQDTKPDLADPNIQLCLQNCVKQLEAWRAKVSDSIMTGNRTSYTVCLDMSDTGYRDAAGAVSHIPVSFA